MQDSKWYGAVGYPCKMFSEKRWNVNCCKNLDKENNW